eukprot:1151094-Rhodomonas_salina.1
MVRPERRESEAPPVCVAAPAMAGLTLPPRPWCRNASSQVARNARGRAADSHRAAYRPVRSSGGNDEGGMGMGNPR